jgi:hypothetical protein
VLERPLCLRYSISENWVSVHFGYISSGAVREVGRAQSRVRSFNILEQSTSGYGYSRVYWRFLVAAGESVCSRGASPSGGQYVR